MTAIDQIEQIRATLAEVSYIDGFRDDLDAARGYCCSIC
jgi:hypothetical protein